MKSAGLLPEAMLLARELFWDERTIFAMPLRRRLAYLMLIEKERDTSIILAPPGSDSTALDESREGFR